jgi:hypothetical protein
MENEKEFSNSLESGFLIKQSNQLSSKVRLSVFS